MKSAAYLQTWSQSTPSKITFDVAHRRGWDYSTNTTATEQSRGADVYVFCVFTARHKARCHRDLVLDLTYWDFYVAPTTRLNSVLGDQKNIALSELVRRVEPAKVSYPQLQAAVMQAAGR